jgi:hypothetical protein
MGLEPSKVEDEDLWAVFSFFEIDWFGLTAVV